MNNCSFIKSFVDLQVLGAVSSIIPRRANPSVMSPHLPQAGRWRIALLLSICMYVPQVCKVVGWVSIRVDCSVPQCCCLRTGYAELEGGDMAYGLMMFYRSIL